MSSAQDIRWRQRFANLQKAFRLFEAAATASQLSTLEEEGLVQRFEYTFELTWKTLKDFLEWEGVIASMNFPREVLQQAFKIGIFTDHDGWREMLKSRNETSHTYDEQTVKKIVFDIQSKFFQLLNDTFQYLQEEYQKPV